MQDLIEELEEYVGKISDPENDDAACGYWWTRIGGLAVRGLKASGVTVKADESREEPEEEAIEPLEYGWSSTPDEVANWCNRFGIPFEWKSGHIEAEFGGKPDAEVLEALKAKTAADGWSGWKFHRSSGIWEHRCCGSWPNSKSGLTAAHREAVEDAKRGRGRAVA